MIRWIADMGYNQIELAHDGESAMVELAESIRSQRQDEQTLPAVTSEGSHQSIGGVEGAH